VNAVELPLPPHFDPSKAETVWRVRYEDLSREARAWAAEHGLRPAASDARRIGLLLIDVQNTFCIPEFELFVAGRSGRGAVEDSTRICRFVYRNLGALTRIVATLDTHSPLQIFHAVFWVDERGEHPPPHTVVSASDVERGVFRINPRLAAVFGKDTADLEEHARHYVRALAEGGKYPLILWPYHAILGGIGHALVSSVGEALFFHSLSRASPTRFELKGSQPLTEHYSALRAEVETDHAGRRIAEPNRDLIEALLGFDALVVAGQAKSHCVAWTLEDLLAEIRARDAKLAGRVYLLEDCTSPVVVPGVVDFTAQGDAAFARFAEAGMHLVRSTEPIESWPGFPARG
jgi:nicotinamidase-related amidase